MEVMSFDPDAMSLTLKIGCSKGTYIRSLARDIGKALGSGAYLTALRRTRVGDVTLDGALTMEQVEDLIRAQKPIAPADGADRQQTEETR